ncbi:MAG: TIGR04551 family protein [Myxococcota bacterium]
MRGFLLCIALLLCLPAVAALAQEPPPTEPPPAEPDEPALDEEGEPGPDDEREPGLDEEEQPPFDQQPRLRAPDMEPPDVTPSPAEEPAEESPEAEPVEEQEETPDDGASPDASAELLEQAEGEESEESPRPSSDPTIGDWAAPSSVLTLHGYFRVRGEIFDNFLLNHALAQQGQPFSRFSPIDNDADCGIDSDAAPCDERLGFANMRLRLQPTLAVSDEVRVHMMVDVFDNLVLGSTPESERWVPSGTTSSGVSREPGVARDSFAMTQLPPSSLRNSPRDSIRVRRAWAEVTSPGLGQVRFGRMGVDWGLGVFQNAGEGIDDDFSTEVDRIMGITKIAGFHLMASWDWAAEGALINDNVDSGDLRNFSLDGTNNDDVRQWTLAAARRMTPEDQAEALDRGDWVLNGGLYFVMRKQDITSVGVSDPFDTEPAETEFFNRDMRMFIPDVWGQFLWKGLRLEAELVVAAGSIENISNDSEDNAGHKIRQLGFAFEGEYRLLEDKLGIHLDLGGASGDPQVDGLSSRENMLGEATNSRLTAFSFHPNYRIDLILWRNIMQRVSGAGYLRPGVSYDFLRSSFGERLGGRFDVIYSRAMTEGQTYGGDKNLGLEMDMSVYYRSEDGPEVMDGFYGLAQFGILFPFDGLGLPDTGGGGVDPGRAWVFRSVLGVQF